MMRWMQVSWKSALVLTFGMLLASITLGDPPGHPASEAPKPDRPIIKVTTPDRISYLMGNGSRTKVLVGIEIIDVGGSGIQTTDSGEPRFVSPNRNVEVFLRHVVYKSTYTNHLGQTVMQLLSVMPAEQLETGEIKVTPPLDLSALDLASMPKDAKIPIVEAVDAAVFPFQVKDRKGVVSDEDAERSTLYVGFATELYRPTLPPVLPKTDIDADGGAEQAPPSR